MPTDDSKNLIRERSRSLREIRHRALSLPPEKALSAILEAENSLEIVHSLPEEDFYFLVHDIGPEDALPLLSLASQNQLEYLLDIDLWDRDRLNHHAAAQWICLLSTADPQRIAQWFSTRKTDFLEFFIFNTIEVKIRESDQDSSDFGDDFITFDDVFYFKLIEFPFGMESVADDSEAHSADGSLKDREELLIKFMKQLSDLDHSLFQNILLESAAIISSETEEELYRLRNVRLAEKGFLPFEESIGIYQPLKPRDITPSRQKRLITPDDGEPFPPIPFFAGRMITPESPFAEALTSLTDENMALQLQAEFAALCNQLIVADRRVIMERPSLRDVVNKVCGYISIGLLNLSGGHRELIRKYPLSDLFRVGYGFALELKWRAEKWRNTSWFASEKLPLGFWGEDWLGVIGGLLLKKPLYFDNYATGVLYREFATLADITETETALNEIIAFDKLLAHLSFPISQHQGQSPLTHKNLILTHWARFHLGLDRELPAVSRISLDAFKTFFNDLWDPGEKPRTVKLSMKTAFLKWLSTESGLRAADISAQSGSTLDTLFSEIENEYGNVDEASLDPRFMPHFLIDKR
jgi:hypothetical protein